MMAPGGFTPSMMHMAQQPGSWQGGPSEVPWAAGEEDSDAGGLRGGYKCSKCGLPKKGHICAYQPRLRRRDEDEPKEKCSISVQVHHLSAAEN